MDKNAIDDIRTSFNNITFSQYQKSKAKSELIKCIYDNKLENAIYWSAEFICAGHFLDLWEIIILYYTKYIHIGNVKLSLYLEMRYMNFFFLDLKFFRPFPFSSQCIHFCSMVKNFLSTLYVLSIFRPKF